jgi:hypothetical protein
MLAIIKRVNPKLLLKFKRLANNMVDIKPNMPVTIILNFIYFIYCLLITILFNYYYTSGKKIHSANFILMLHYNL